VEIFQKKKEKKDIAKGKHGKRIFFFEKSHHTF